MDVIPLDASLVRGSHGRVTNHADEGPLVIVDRPELPKGERLAATGVRSLLLDTMFE